MTGKKKPLVVVTRRLPDPVETRMRELFDTRLNVDDKPMSQPELLAALKEDRAYAKATHNTWAAVLPRSRSTGTAPTSCRWRRRCGRWQRCVRSSASLTEWGASAARAGRPRHFAAPTRGCVHAVSNSLATLPFTLGFDEMTFART